MTAGRQSDSGPGVAERSGPANLRLLLGGEARALLAIAAACLVVELGVFILARVAGIRFREAAIATIASCAIWAALACPVLAACGRGYMSTLLRGAISADLTLLVLWVMWACDFGGGHLTFVATLKLYCTFLAMSLAASAAVALARTSAARLVTAFVVAIVMTAMLATPFWVNALLVQDGGTSAAQTRHTLAGLAVYLNPFYSVTSSVVLEMQYVPHMDDGLLYRLTMLGDVVGVPPCPWWAATAIYLPLAAFLGGVKLVLTSRPAYNCPR